MTLKAKITALEKAAKDAIPIGSCSNCGYPHPRGRSVLLLEPNDDGKVQVRRCGRCNRLLDQRGVPYGMVYADGRVRLRKVVLLPESIVGCAS